MVKLYTRQSLHTTTQLLHGSSGTTATIWSNYTQDKSTYYNTANLRLQWNYGHNLVKLYTRQSLHTTTQLLQGSRELEPKFGQIIHKTSLHTTTQLLQGSSGTTAKVWSNYTQDKAYTLQHSYSKAPVKLEPKFGQIIHKTSLHTTTQLLQGSSGTTAKVWSNYTQDKAYTLQHSYSKAPVKLEPKFGQIIHKTKSTYYNTATPRLQWNYSQSLV